MQRPTTSRLDRALAREVALREGLKATLAGEIAAVGSQYVLSAQLLSAATGEVLAARRETASDSTQIIHAVDRVSKKLREKIGESLKALRAEAPLEQVTTSSLGALRKYSLALRAAEVEGDDEKAAALLEEAVALDSGFAMAYRRLGITRRGLDQWEPAAQALTEAFRHRDRLSARERYHSVAIYYWLVLNELEKAAATYRALLESYPDDVRALNNLGTVYVQLRQDARAVPLFRRVIALDFPAAQPYASLIEAQVHLGKRREAEATLERATARFLSNPRVER
jgi:tetratricopeptide (TPR) repeat protein